jgi:cytochrome c oxidase assembly factor CtaG
VLSRLSHRRSWLAAAAVVLIVVCLVPPVGTYARRYVFVESLQFALFAAAIPALLVLGAPWRRLAVFGPLRGLLGEPVRPARLRRRGSGFRAGVAVLLAFIGTVIAWRLPASVNALATLPGLAVLEMASLVGVGSALWLELVESPPLLPRLSRPLRAAFAAAAMWTIWILAYILGFSHVAFFGAYTHAGLSVVADQEIATGILWAVPALCFIPVVYVAALTWLQDTEDPDEGLRALVRAEQPPPQERPGRWPRPPRGWDTHST